MNSGRDERAATPPEDPSNGAHANLDALARDQSIADLDQRASEADQGGTWLDQAGSDRDDADAASDQRAADRDQARADHVHRQAAAARAAADGRAANEFDGTYEATTAARDISRIDRLASHAARAGTSATRLVTMRERDRNAVRRDDTARRREVRSLEIEEAIATLDAPLSTRFAKLREQAALDRARAASERRHAATARASASAQRVRLQVELHTAHLDDLTGAFRRETGRDALALEIERAHRGDGRFALAFLDIDGLKAINDRAGHAAGDLVLRTLVAIVRSRLRSFDPVVRYGGDEFACGIGGVELDEVARRLAVVGRELYADTGASFSAGLAAIAPGETLDRLIGRADAALLAAKTARPDSASDGDPDRDIGSVPGAIRISETTATLVKVASTSDLAQGRTRVFDVAGTKVGIANAGGRLLAFDDVCTHAACSLAEGQLDGTILTCPCHGSQFDLATGDVVRGPARLPVRIRAARADGEDIVVEA